ncbi:CLUMA_CG005755, isoform A [Clunio marinus]|uniref:CLUMA_CG005755, isoform A n=1 Tax=Clunio marinus TaxID=568069 RepID=A0A1J1HVP1_9DIPT|nr:CLUMA_CG005755, isoform A [Clunio marinus]
MIQGYFLRFFVLICVYSNVHGGGDSFSMSIRSLSSTPSPSGTLIIFTAGFYLMEGDDYPICPSCDDKSALCTSCLGDVPTNKCKYEIVNNLAGDILGCCVTECGVNSGRNEIQWNSDVANKIICSFQLFLSNHKTLNLMF